VEGSQGGIGMPSVSGLGKARGDRNSCSAWR